MFLTCFDFKFRLPSWCWIRSHLRFSFHCFRAYRQTRKDTRRPLFPLRAMTKGYSHVSMVEKKIIKNMVKEKLPWCTIQKVTERSSSTIQRIVLEAKGASAKAKPKGAPVKATKKVVSAIVRSARMLQKQAGAKHEVTAAMIKAHAGVDLCDKVVRNKLHEADMWFFCLKERPTLTKQDVKDRLKWARKHLSRSRASWLTMPHAIIDNKTWPVYTNKEGREHAARRCVRGAYQTRGQKPESHVIKPKPQTKFPAKGVQVTAAVINGRIRMWEYLPKRWNGAAAAAMYQGPLLKALSKAFPAHAASGRKWTVLEDNDPAGYKSGKAVAAKSAVGIGTDDLPRRSPDLNVLDYSLWHAINVKMRRQERGFRPATKETRSDYLARLRRAALGLPQGTVQKAVADMHRRVREVIAENGGLFTE